jgi:lysozyme
MERSLEFYGDGHVIEIENDQPIRIANTQNDVTDLLAFLQFSSAQSYTLAPADQAPPTDVAQPRGGQQINAAGIKLLTAFEGCELKAYQDSVRVWTIGYGHTKTAKPGMTITQAQAEQLLQDDLAEFEAAVESTVNVGLNDDQFSALVSFCFNLGARSLFDSTLLRVLNQGNFAAAANEFPRWNKAGQQQLLGLTRRRLAERSLFLSQPWEAFRDYDKLELKSQPIQGSFVRQVQQSLKQAGFDLQVNGVFDTTTEKAVKQFQQQKQLGADGIVGLETTKVLFS